MDDTQDDKFVDKWSSTDNPVTLLAMLRCANELNQYRHDLWLTDRKLRLYGCACCRQILDLLPDHRSREAVETAERYADSLATVEELDAASANAARATYTGNIEPTASIICDRVFSIINFLGTPRRQWPLGHTEIQADILRDLVGDNPLDNQVAGQHAMLGRHGVLDWNGSTVPRLALVAYDERNDYGRIDAGTVMVLADALEEALWAVGGIDEYGMIRHLRNDKHHYRGCWVIDIILGRV